MLEKLAIHVMHVLYALQKHKLIATCCEPSFLILGWLKKHSTYGWKGTNLWCWYRSCLHYSSRKAFARSRKQKQPPSLGTSELFAFSTEKPQWLSLCGRSLIPQAGSWRCSCSVELTLSSTERDGGDVACTELPVRFSGHNKFEK